MPLLNLMTSANEIPEQNEIIKELSSLLASLTNKPEQYVMISIQKNVHMIFAGTKQDCCFIEVKSIGSIRPSEMTRQICDFVELKLGIPSQRIYLNFQDIEACNWGFNGNTFG